jgi:putative intracellular protease/amidase
VFICGAFDFLAALRKMKIGILAIQGDYEAHAQMLQRIGVHNTFVRTPQDLRGLNGIILPGGESTTHLKVMTEEGLFDALKQFAAKDGALFGTCAGTILLAKEVHGPPQASRCSTPPFCATATAASWPATSIWEKPSCTQSRWKWSSSALPSSKKSARTSKFSQKMRVIRFSSARAASLRPRFIPN